MYRETPIVAVVRKLYAGRGKKLLLAVLTGVG
jgi:hypothetical protein